MTRDVNRYAPCPECGRRCAVRTRVPRHVPAVCETEADVAPAGRECPRSGTDWFRSEGGAMLDEVRTRRETSGTARRASLAEGVEAFASAQRAGYSLMLLFVECRSRGLDLDVRRDVDEGWSVEVCERDDRGHNVVDPSLYERSERDEFGAIAANRLAAMLEGARRAVEAKP